jgi:hypothetical protein
MANAYVAGITAKMSVAALSILNFAAAAWRMWTAVESSGAMPSRVPDYD